jgi:fatty-acyl-CoA synthase
VDGPRSRGTAAEFNLAELQEALAARIGARDALVSPSRRVSWSELTERTRRLANFLLDRGLSLWAERDALGPSESGQDRVAICLHTSPEYIETMVGCFKARLAPCNVNYRYVPAELADLLTDMAPAALVYEPSFADRLGAALSATGQQPVLIEVGGDPGQVALPDAIPYEAALASASPDRPGVEWRPDDLYILYTGGTTGQPKGVLWRQADVFVTALGGRNYRDGEREWCSLEEMVDDTVARRGVRALSAAPLMHGTGQWISLQALHTGGAVIIPAAAERFDADAVLDAVARERVQLLAIAGESFAKPLLEAMDGTERDLSALSVLASSGAALTAASKRALVARIPRLRIRDTMGASEAGPVAEAGTGTADGPVRFLPSDDTHVVDEAQQRFLAPGHRGTGWLARGGRIPLGYLNDPAKTARTFKVVEGLRVTIPGDRARLAADGTVEVLGRDAVTINSGGEKIFAEEVEAAVMRHPGVRDVLVVGRPSERWGSEVVALVETEPGVVLDPAEVIETCRASVAGYKAPKAVVIVDRVRRNPAGKADYTWARDVVARSSV